MSLPARVTAVTIVNVQGDAEHLLGQWQVHVPHSGTARFTVRVDGWQGPPLKLEGSAEMTIVRRFRAQGAAALGDHCSGGRRGACISS